MEPNPEDRFGPGCLFGALAGLAMGGLLVLIGFAVLRAREYGYTPASAQLFSGIMLAVMVAYLAALAAQARRMRREGLQGRRYVAGLVTAGAIILGLAILNPFTLCAWISACGG